MNGAERRDQIMQRLRASQEPISGTELAKWLGVSRQVIVQDIALIRAENKNILSTNKGYLLFQVVEYPDICRRVYAVQHTTAQLLDELLTIVDLGGRVLDVSVEHEVYGQISCDLIINTRRDAVDFSQRLTLSRGNPLKILTDDHHYHTVEASSEQLLDVIERALAHKGYLLTEKPEIL